ncbi:MAG: hypothetical protein NZ853_08925 [Leptospiraceae bacterium]|nr:hypothetical protein [Leptospiraceae bacterium]MDW7975550.1 hypothetical protein [Leptospiraceae bacterium]
MDNTAKKLKEDRMPSETKENKIQKLIHYIQIDVKKEKNYLEESKVDAGGE